MGGGRGGVGGQLSQWLEKKLQTLSSKFSFFHSLLTTYFNNTDKVTTSLKCGE